MRLIGVTRGMRGYFAVLYDEDGPIQSSPLSFNNPTEAARDARDWAGGETNRLDEEAKRLLKTSNHKEQP